MTVELMGRTVLQSLTKELFLKRWGDSVIGCVEDCLLPHELRPSGFCMQVRGYPGEVFTHPTLFNELMTHGTKFIWIQLVLKGDELQAKECDWTAEKPIPNARVICRAPVAPETSSSAYAGDVSTLAM